MTSSDRLCISLVHASFRVLIISITEIELVECCTGAVCFELFTRIAFHSALFSWFGALFGSLAVCPVSS